MEILLLLIRPYTRMIMPLIEGLPKQDTGQHSVGEYVKGQAHINGVESFWAMLKRGYYGVIIK